ncbi:MAG: caspase family protein [Chitinophagaceae bacterium]
MFTLFTGCAYRFVSRKLILSISLLLISPVLFSQVELTVNIPQSNARLITTDNSGEAIITVTNNMLFRWDIRTGRCLKQVKLQGDTRHLKLSTGKKYLVTAEEEGGNTFLGVYKLSDLDHEAYVMVDSFTASGKNYPSERKIEDIAINEKTGWLAAVMGKAVFFYNIHSKQRTLVEIKDGYTLSAVAYCQGAWLVSGYNFKVKQPCIWKIRETGTDPPESVILFNSYKNITALVSFPDDQKVLAVAEFKKIVLLHGSPLQQKELILQKDISLLEGYYQYSWESGPLLQISTELGAYTYNPQDNSITKLKRGKEMMDYFIMPVTADKNLYLDKARNRTAALFTYDYSVFDTYDTIFSEQSVVNYGTNNMMRFDEIRNTGNGKYYLSNAAEISILNLNRLQMRAMQRDAGSDNVPLYQFLYLPGCRKPAELFWKTNPDKETVYSLMEFGEDGQPDTIYTILTLPASSRLLSNGLFYTGRNNDSIYIFDTEAKAFYLNFRGNKKNAEKFPLPDKIGDFSPVFENHFTSLSAGHFLLAADKLINYDIRKKSWKIIDEGEYSNFLMMAYDTISQVQLYKDESTFQLKSYRVKTGDTATLLGLHDTYNIRLIRPVEWKGKAGYWMVVTRSGMAEIRNSNLSETLDSFVIEKNTAVLDLLVDKAKGLLFFLLNDYSMRVYDASTLEHVSRIYFNKQLDEDYAVAFDKDNNYFMPARQTQMINWVYKNQAYDFSVFDSYFNKPARILTSLKTTDTSYTRLLEKATSTRLKRLKSVTDINRLEELPVCRIDKEKIPYITDSSQLAIPVYLHAGNRPLTRFQVYINYVPVLVKDLAVLKTPLKPGTDSSFIFYTTISSKKSNHIGVRAYDEKDQASLPAETYVYRRGATDNRLSKKWYLGIGTSRYRDSLFNLKYASKDVKDIASGLKEKVDQSCRGGFETITDSLVTIGNVVKGFAWLARNASADDVVIISFSGHGVTEKDGKFYFMMYNSDFRNPAKNPSLPIDILFEMLKILPCRNKLVLLDACESGDFDDEGFMTRPLPARTEIVDITASRGFKVGNNRNETYLEVMKEYFADLSTESGATIIGASSGTSMALENDDWKNGVFSFAFMEGLLDFKADLNKDERITIGELKDYMGRRVERLTNGKQRPSSRNIDLRNDWIIIDRVEMK